MTDDKGSATPISLMNTNDSKRRYTHRESGDDDPRWEALMASDPQSTQGLTCARGSSLHRNESRRGLGSACMRYSPSGSHLAIGCKNGYLVIMAIDHSTVGDGSYDPDEAEMPGKKTEDLEDNHDPKRDGIRSDSHEVDLMMSATRGEEIKETFPVPQRGLRYRRVACLKGHSSRILHLDWTKDGRFLQTCGQDYQLLHWEVIPSEDGTYSNTTGRAANFRPRIFLRPFLLRDAQWATWSSTIGWPVQVK